LPTHSATSNVLQNIILEIDSFKKIETIMI